MFGEKGTIYALNEDAQEGLTKKLKEINERVSLLRTSLVLTDEILKRYYGQKRFEMVAESNALEGSTLSVGETELAITKGITITGHEPAYVRDAISLDKALTSLFNMARDSTPLDLEQVLNLHHLILGDRPGSGVLRKERVRISGSKHQPPQTWNEVLDQMKNWEAWSRNSLDLAAPVRAIILHAWLAHIHSFIDGNGRCARAITNLELVRGGYPPIIIKKKDRNRYLDALSDSDEGHIQPMMEFLFGLIDDALIGLELSARQSQGYHPLQEKILQKQRRVCEVFLTSVRLLAETTVHYLSEFVEGVSSGQLNLKTFDPLEFEDYLLLCDRRSVSHAWAFRLELSIPGFPSLEMLAYYSYRSPSMYHHFNDTGGPSLFWSTKNPSGYPTWRDTSDMDWDFMELSTKAGIGDLWTVRTANGIHEMSTTGLAESIHNNFLRIFENQS